MTRNRSGGPVVIGEILKQIKRDYGFDRQDNIQELSTAWIELFGTDKGEPKDRKGDELIVKVDSSTERYEYQSFSYASFYTKISSDSRFRGIKKIVFVEK